ncbi:hypothetical protein BTW08_18190, partial [Salinicola sp. MH3R3-1]|uniref:EF-hand domain-containing protein n=1 Tax=Salinicola sp. MH3R3-1 TaxID=1928762 RepID=UPI000969BAD9
KSTSAGAASPADQLAAAGGAFREQLEAARGGDREALNSITQYADRYMSAQRNWSGSGGETATVIDRIETALSQLPEQLSPEQFLSDEFAKQIAGQTDSLATAIDLNGDGTKTALKAAITKNLDTTSRLSASLVETMRAAGDKALTVSQVRGALAGKATDAEISSLIGRVDANGDGMISATELAAADTTSNLVGTLRDQFGDLSNQMLTGGQIRSALAGKATDAEISSLIGRVDANGDGMISATELAAADTTSSLVRSLQKEFGGLASTVLTVSQVREALAGKATDAEITKLVETLDANGDGLITLAEAQREATAGLPGAIAASLAPLFDSIDLNLDGVITFDEMRRALSGIASDDQLRQIFRTLDVNGDGQITRLEALRQSTDRTGDNTGDISGLTDRTLGQLASMDKHVRYDWR